jgi:hypothetical protein
MKEKRSSSKSHKKKNLESVWEESAAFYESPESIDVLQAGEPLEGVERRKLLGPGKKKMVAVRLPEDDIESLKTIAKRHNRKYQQLVVHAVEQFLDRYQKSAIARKKAI